MAHYEIRVAGVVSAAELGELEGMQVSSDGTCLRLSGDVVDAAALHGILARLSGLRLRLVEVTRTGTAPEPPDVVRFRGHAAGTLAQRFPGLLVRQGEDVTEVSGHLEDADLLDLLGTAQALRLDVVEVRRSEPSTVTPVG
jgi:hypothetical protein